MGHPVGKCIGASCVQVPECVDKGARCPDGFLTGSFRFVLPVKGG